MFIDDIYHRAAHRARRRVPASLPGRFGQLSPQCVGIDPPQGIWAHICGSDLVRGADGTMYVLEDNLRVPSGVSYMLENRQVVKRVFPEVFEAAGILPVDDYPSQLLRHAARAGPGAGASSRRSWC